MIESYVNQRGIDIFHLSDGLYMVNHITGAMASWIWNSMDANQKEEFEIIYGVDDAFNGFVSEIRASDHCAAFFDCTEICCMMWAGWQKVPVFGNRRVRTLGCVCSEYAKKHMFKFVKHSKECRDAFELMEPKEATEIYVFITESFKQSREWAIRICGLKHECSCVGGKLAGDFVCYKHVYGED